MVASSIKVKFLQMLSFPDELQPDYWLKLTFGMQAYITSGQEFADEVDLFNFIPYLFHESS